MITRSRLDEIAEKLKSLPALPQAERQHTNKEAVQMLKPVIQSMKKKGYSLEQIASYLRTEDVKITATTLRSYLTSKKRISGERTAPSVKTTSTTDENSIVIQTQPAQSTTGSYQVRPDTTDL